MVGNGTDVSASDEGTTAASAGVTVGRASAAKATLAGLTTAREIGCCSCGWSRNRLSTAFNGESARGHGHHMTTATRPKKPTRMGKESVLDLRGAPSAATQASWSLS